MGKVNAWGELDLRWRELLTFIQKHTLSGQLVIAANNLYDAAYTEYFTGVRPEYIPSWCGDADNSFGGRSTAWEGCVLNDTHIYDPVYNYSLFVPYKTLMWEFELDIEGLPMWNELKQAMVRACLSEVLIHV